MASPSATHHRHVDCHISRMVSVIIVEAGSWFEINREILNNCLLQFFEQFWTPPTFNFKISTFLWLEKKDSIQM